MATKSKSRKFEDSMFAAHEYEKAGEYHSALTCYKLAIRANPKSAGAHFNKAIMLGYTEKPDETKKEIAIAANLDPTRFGTFAKMPFDEMMDAIVGGDVKRLVKLVRRISAD